MKSAALTHDIIGFKQLQACQDAAFRHAFAWTHKQRPESILNNIIRPGLQTELNPVLDLV